MISKEEVLTTGCNTHCGGSCLLKVHVRDGVIIHIDTDDQDEPQLRACLRCRAYRQRVYAPDRLLYPMKRVGDRGEGKFERISWDEALGVVAGEYKRIKGTYGPASVLYIASGGDVAELNSQKVAHRVFCMAGGCSGIWGVASNEGEAFAALATYGTTEIANTHDDFVNSQLIILWGMNSANVIDGCGTTLAMVKAKEAGTRFIVIDPRFTDTAAILADRWIPIRPGTDTAVMLAIAYVIITESLFDQKFLDTYTVGFDIFKEYVLGKDNGVAKTPYWAEHISGIQAQHIAELAREYATMKPAALLTSMAPGRTAMGEQYHRAAYVLAAMTGNIGTHGGNSGGRLPLGLAGKLGRLGRGMRSGGNPVEAGSPRRFDALRNSGAAGFAARVHNSRVMDAILRGRDGGYPSDYKMLYLVNSNYLNQFPNVNKTIQALKSLEFIAVQEQFMTSTAKFADILLPTCTFLERNDITTGAGPHISYTRKMIEPLGESRAQLDIATGLAQKLDIASYNDKTEEEWLREIIEPVVADYDEFKETGVHKLYLEEPFVAFKDQIDDPINNPFPTPSGKIEIYSQDLADMNIPLIPPVPKYIEAWESLNDPLAKKYPLQLITSHHRSRAHSQFDNIPWLRELDPQAVMVSTADAEARGIKNGDLVRVFNERGEMVIPVKVTERIMPGVVDVPEGAWYIPDERGIDRGGCANVLTRDRPSPGGAFPANTALVQVERL
ncbi:molybdopterin-dependent oxidoreductase [Chloroflexota bacterium]